MTFDDGYFDNLSEALPVLERHGIPATVFIASGQLGRSDGFWWDDLTRLLVAEALPKSLTIRGSDGTSTIDLSAHEHLAELRGWRLSDGVSTPRQRMVQRAYELLRPVPAANREVLMRELLSRAGLPRAGSRAARLMNPNELLDFAQSGLIDVGAHTVTHPDLTTQSIDEQRRELSESRHTLEQILSRPVTMFAYPYGRFAEDTPGLLREVGFTCACTGATAVVGPASDLLRLPRLMVEDWNGEDFLRQVTRLVH